MGNPEAEFVTPCAATKTGIIVYRSTSAQPSIQFYEPTIESSARQSAYRAETQVQDRDQGQIQTGAHKATLVGKLEAEKNHIDASARSFS